MDALNRCNYLGLKLIKQTMKVLERVVEGLTSGKDLRLMSCSVALCQVVALQMQFSLSVKYKRSTLLQTNCSTWPSLIRRKDDIWWAMRKLGIDEWLVRLVQSMYKDVRSRVRVGSEYSEEFGVKVGVHQVCPKPATLHHCARVFIQGLPNRLP